MKRYLLTTAVLSVVFVCSGCGEQISRNRNIYRLDNWDKFVDSRRDDLTGYQLAQNYHTNIVGNLTATADGIRNAMRGYPAKADAGEYQDLSMSSR